jgi:hypothetical protein
MPKAGVLRFDDEVFVAQVRYGDVVVRHYAWRDHWFKINCTTDLRSRLIETTAPDDVPPLAFNCDIATPMVRDGDAVFAVDLWLDVLVRGDGVTHGVYAATSSTTRSRGAGCASASRPAPVQASTSSST